MPTVAADAPTPLLRKLGIIPGARVRFVDPPENFRAALGPLPAGAREMAPAARALDLVVVFAARDATRLTARVNALLPRIAVDGMLWVGWPKKASGRDTDVSERVVRAIGLAAGWVDVKVCAIDSVWAGLKFVRRLKDRESRNHDR